MKKFFEEILKRLQSPVVITAIVLFILQTLVASDIIKLGETELAELAEFISSLITKVFVGFAILNNPSDRKAF